MVADRNAANAITSQSRMIFPRGQYQTKIRIEQGGTPLCNLLLGLGFLRLAIGLRHLYLCASSTF